MTGFLKLLLLLVLVGAAAFVASVDAGRVTVTWFNIQVETTGIVLVMVMALVCFISMAVMRLMLSLAGVPEHVQHWREKREWAKKEAELEAEKNQVIVVTKPVPMKVTKPKRRGQK